MTAELWDRLDDEGRAFLSQTLQPDRPLVQGPAPVAPASGHEPMGAPVVGAPSVAAQGPPTVELAELLTATVRAGASDLHLSAEWPPYIRVGGELRPLGGIDPPTRDQLRAMVFASMDASQQDQISRTGDLDMALETEIEGLGLRRFRASIFRQSGSIAAAFRVIADSIPNVAQLGLPRAATGFMELRKGLVLVTGQTGSGKSTTLAAMIETINRQRPAHIITIEDPIEYRLPPGLGVIQQREVGPDTASFSTALRHALRQDPDVLLIGELRDLETIRTALTAAETGHLVLATLHSSNASSAVNRLIDVFPPDQQSQIRSQLALSLEGIISQQLLPGLERPRVPATEVLVATSGARNMIREDKVHQLPSVLETGGTDGMHTFDQSLADLVRRRLISPDVAMGAAQHAGNLQELLQR